MKLSEFDPDTITAAKDALDDLFKAGADDYGVLMHVVRVLVNDTLRRNGQKHPDRRLKRYFMTPVNIWDVSTGIETPLWHRMASTETYSVDGLLGVVERLESIFKAYFQEWGEPVPQPCTLENLLPRMQSLRNQIMRNGGECSFRTRWTAENGNPCIAIVNIGRSD